MKKIYILISAVAALALTSACNLKTEFPPLIGENVVSFDLRFMDPGVKSDATDRENAVTSVDYFFYSDITKDPIFSKRDSDPTITGGKYTISLTAGEEDEGVLVPGLTDLFKDGRFEVFAVFNAPSQITAAPLEDVKQTAVANSFAYDDDGWIVTTEEDPEPSHPRFFVMVGQATVNKANSGNYANVPTEVEMKRLAAKVAVNLKITDNVTVDDTHHWVPMIGGQNVRLYLCNFALNTVVGAFGETPVYPETISQDDYKPFVLDTDNLKASSGKYVVASQQDFYSYPIEWEAGSDNEPFIKLVLPWRQVEGTTSQKELYYKIMFPSDITSLDANMYYQLDVDITLLGTEGEPTVVVKAQKAQVVNWITSSDVNSTISDAKYLSVEREFTNFFTQNAGIGFVASEIVSMTILEISQQNLYTGETEYLVQNGIINESVRGDLGAKEFIYEDDDEEAGVVIGFKITDTEGKVSEWIKLDNSVSYLSAGHTLDMDLTSPHLDVTPWKYVVKLHLVGASDAYDRTVTFEQEPQLYIKADPNSNNGAYTNSGIYVNADQTTGNNNLVYGAFNLGSATGITSSSGNKNGNMYVITISVSDKYNIGDPRSKTSTSYPEFQWQILFWSGSYWKEAPVVGGGADRTIANYHPASNTGTENMIAPKIRIASSYGVTRPVDSRAEAEYRCAGYQEDGIPAGRWRLPTYAEIKFIASLSVLQRIPILYGEDTGNTDYWTANGLIRVNNANHTAEPQTGNNAYVRCVYDEWFWGDAIESRPVNKGTFTWGDLAY